MLFLAGCCLAFGYYAISYSKSSSKSYSVICLLPNDLFANGLAFGVYTRTLLDLALLRELILGSIDLASFFDPEFSSSKN
jgi:hypothetical protein